MLLALAGWRRFPVIREPGLGRFLPLFLTDNSDNSFGGRNHFLDDLVVRFLPHQLALEVINLLLLLLEVL